MLVLLLVTLLMAAACSTTSNLPEGDVLYTGMKKTKIYQSTGSYNENVALTEVQAALAYAPNNSFMGSSSVRAPLPIGLWVYNSMINKEHTAFGKWVLNTFGRVPITVAAVNPVTRTKVATNILQNYGYFNGLVDYETITQRNPRKQKIRYDIYLDKPYMLDSIRYLFRGTQDSIVQANMSKTYLHQGDQFNVPNLQAEKERITTDLRNNGYYYYRTDYVRYFADSTQTPYQVKMLVAPDLDMPDRAKRQWHIGNIHTYIRQSQNNLLSSSRRSTQPLDSAQQRERRRRMTQYDDSLNRGPYRYVFQGKKVPIKPRVLFKNFAFKRKDLYDQSHIDQTLRNLSNMQVFSQLQISFTPRDTTALCDTLDVRFDATMDKLIDTEFDFSFTQKSNSQVGPKAGMTISKRNAFGHGETLSMSAMGSYEWQTGNRVKTNNERPDSWEAKIDASLTYPWIAFPGFWDRNFKRNTSTTFRISIDNLKRAGYYRLVSFGAEATYRYRTSDYLSHQFTPLSLTYNKLINTSAKFDSITATNSALYISMRDQFIPAIQYVLTYDNSSNTHKRWNTRFVATVKESGNALAGIMTLQGRDWNQENKRIIDTPFSQFLKVNLELANKFKLTDKTEIATRLQAGVVWTYGNSSIAPYSELFFVGGANSIRAFGARTIGPGRYYDRSGRGTYLDQSGDLRLEANAEYRFNLVSNLYGALFVDAGNTWLLRPDDSHPGGAIEETEFLKSIALGTGFGLRYDLEFLVLRVDLGVGIHAPYETGKRGYYNMPKFGESLGFHFAVGYPF